ncbi:secretin N-terminal domain-containing protein [Pseudoalteromonas pernae]|uniref:secretin N-terminal domain-containing protein n=1 Tax=Pseudoalteromonas pernae TaxID=3118054 RepID=UPI00324293C6
MKTSKYNRLSLLVIATLISGCANLVEPNAPYTNPEIDAGGSYLASSKEAEADIDNQAQEATAESEAQFQILASSRDNDGAKLELDLSKRFGVEKRYQVSVNELPFNEFLHYTLGELFQVSYLIEPSIKAKQAPVTLELKEKVSAQRLFQLLQQVLDQNGASIQLTDDVFYVYPQPKRGNNSDKAFGFGSNAKNVPNVAGNVIQFVPVKYHNVRGLEDTLKGLVDATVRSNTKERYISIQGNREQILRALSLLELLDSPMLYSKSVALLNFRYIDTYTYIEKATELLEQDGISTNLNAGRDAASVSFIPLEHLGKVVVFASDDEVLNRIQYWSALIDKPAVGSEQSFYIYHPKYARASDLGTSLAPLLRLEGNSSMYNRESTQSDPASSLPSQSAVGNTRENRNTRASNQQQSIEGDGIRMVVDERANALIFYSTGKYYQELQPIIKKLDIMPKQVMMEVVIAEVKLTGSFSKGVQYALESGASGDTNETFSFSSGDGFNYSIVGLPGSISVNLNESNSLVNVLSRPTLLVRDGVAANISVGDDIPTIGSTTLDPINGERQTTEIQYRKTGVDLKVTPTINAQGTVIMTISQSISNVSPDSTGLGGTPAIFERSINTEVVAGNGQTVMLGGLISENHSNNASQIPVLGDIPGLGHLFRSDGESSDKTELVVLVTPKIVENEADWERLKDSFRKGLKHLQF